MKLGKKIFDNVLYNLAGGGIVILILNAYAAIAKVSLSFNGWQSLVLILVILILGGLLGYWCDKNKEEEE